MYSYLSYLFMIFVLFSAGRSADFLQVDFSPENMGIFASESDCQTNDIRVDEYSNFLNITPPHGSNGYFMGVSGSGCLVTNPFPCEAGSQFILIYKSHSPGIKFEIVINGFVYEPALVNSGWETFVQTVERGDEKTQIKFLSTFESGAPLLIIDRFEVTPPLIPRADASGDADTGEEEHVTNPPEGTVVEEMTEGKVERVTERKEGVISGDETEDIAEKDPDDDMRTEELPIIQPTEFTPRTFDNINDEDSGITDSLKVTTIAHGNEKEENEDSMITDPVKVTKIARDREEEGEDENSLITNPREGKENDEDSIITDPVKMTKLARYRYEDDEVEESTIYEGESSNALTKSTTNKVTRKITKVTTEMTRKESGKLMGIAKLRAMIFRGESSESKLEIMDRANARFWRNAGMTAVFIGAIILAGLFAVMVYLINTRCV